MIKSFSSAERMSSYIDSKIHGSFLVSDIEFIGTYVKQLKLGDKYLEVGTGYGKSIASAIWQAPEGVVFMTIDMADLPTLMSGHLSRQKFFEQEGFERGILDDVCTFIQADSLKVAEKCPDNEFNMIFIDADHSYESGKADIIAWLPKLKPGGFMVFHDYSDQQFTLSKAVDELVRDSGLFTDFRVARNLGFGISSMAGAIKK